MLKTSQFSIMIQCNFIKKKIFLNFYTNLIIIEMMEPVFILLHQFIYRTIFT